MCGDAVGASIGFCISIGGFVGGISAEVSIACCNSIGASICGCVSAGASIGCVFAGSLLEPYQDPLVLHLVSDQQILEPLLLPVFPTFR